MNAKHRDIFNCILNDKVFKYTNKQISLWCGFDESKLSRFLSGKRDLKASEFFYMLECMPKEFQKRFWNEFHASKDHPDLEKIIVDMDAISLAKLMGLIGENLIKKVAEYEENNGVQNSLLNIKLRMKNL